MDLDTACSDWRLCRWHRQEERFSPPRSPLIQRLLWRLGVEPDRDLPLRPPFLGEPALAESARGISLEIQGGYVVEHQAGSFRESICIQVSCAQAIATSSHEIWFLVKAVQRKVAQPGVFGVADAVLAPGAATVPKFQVSERAALSVGSEGGEPVPVNIGEPQLRARRGRSLQTIARVPSGQPDNSSRPVSSATRAPGRTRSFTNAGWSADLRADRVPHSGRSASGQTRRVTDNGGHVTDPLRQMYRQRADRWPGGRSCEGGRRRRRRLQAGHCQRIRSVTQCNRI